MKLFIITGTCGAGKSTMKDELAARLGPARYACVDSDETGLNWWDYVGTPASIRTKQASTGGTMPAPNGKDSTARIH